MEPESTPGNNEFIRIRIVLEPDRTIPGVPGMRSDDPGCAWNLIGRSWMMLECDRKIKNHDRSILEGIGTISGPDILPRLKSWEYVSNRSNICQSPLRIGTHLHTVSNPRCPVVASQITRRRSSARSPYSRYAGMTRPNRACRANIRS